MNSRHQTFLFIFVAYLLLIVNACSSAEDSPEPLGEPQLSAIQLGNSVDLISDTMNVEASTTIVLRIVIKNAALNLTVENPAEIAGTISQLADEAGGWVISSNTINSTRADGTGTTRATIAIRVPAERFNEVLDNIKAIALSVNAENITGQDVTEEYTDLTSRLANLRVAEQQLHTLMQSAANVDEVLTVQSELTRVRGEIETTSGRMRLIDESASYSSITVNLETEPSQSASTNRATTWKPLETAESALFTLIDVLRTLADLVIVLVIFVLPLVLIFGMPGLLLFRLSKRFGFRSVGTKSALGDPEQLARPDLPDE